VRTPERVVDLPRFSKALETARSSLPANTHWRYSRGLLPRRFIRLLIDWPELAQALAEDVATLAQRRRDDR
jgi:hypothetical protein